MLYKGDCQSNSFAMHAGTGLHLHQHLHNKSSQLSIVQQVSIAGETCKGGCHINHFTASGSVFFFQGSQSFKIKIVALIGLLSHLTELSKPLIHANFQRI